MDLANRFVVILLALLLIFGVAVVILLAWAAGPETVERLGDFVQYLDDHVAEEDGGKVIVTLGGVVIALLALLGVFIELAPPAASAVPVRDVQAGNAVLSTDAVARRVQEEVGRLPQVAQAKATVAARGKGVEVSLELHVAPDANLATTSEAACQVVLEVVTAQLGVEMVKVPHVKLHLAEAPRSAAATTPSRPSEGPPSASASSEPASGGAQADPPHTG